MNITIITIFLLLLLLFFLSWMNHISVTQLTNDFIEHCNDNGEIWKLLNKGNLLDEKMFDCRKNTEYNLPPDYEYDEIDPLAPYNEKIFHIGNIYKVNDDNRIKILEKADNYIVVKNIDNGNVNICDQWYDRENKCCWLNYFPLGKNVNCRTDVLGENYYKFNKYIFENEEK